MPDSLLHDLDSYCEKHMFSRSEFLRNAVRDIVYKVVIEDKLKEPPTEKYPSMGKSHCKHGYLYGLCKFGCQL
jgi:hypothetical protein